MKRLNIDKQVLECYNELGIQSSRAIARKIGVSTGPVCRIMKKLGLKYYGVPDINFSVPLDNGQSWLAGLLATDGCVCKKRNRVRLVSTDEELIDKAINILHYGCKHSEIHNQGFSNNSKVYVAEWCRHGTKQTCLKLNIVPAKSFILTPPCNTDIQLSHFVRGLIDGDGCISFRNTQHDSNITKLCVSFYSASQKMVDFVGDSICLSQKHFNCEIEWHKSTSMAQLGLL